MSRNVVLSLVVAVAAGLQGCARPPVRTPASAGAVLWREPSAHRPETTTPPRPPFRFVDEDMAGDSPKLLVADASGTRWQIKLGAEAQTETVAVRIVNAVGFFAEQLRVVSTEQVLERLELDDADAVRRLPEERQRSVVVSILRREMGVMTLAAVVVCFLAVRAIETL